MIEAGEVSVMTEDGRRGTSSDGTSFGCFCRRPTSPEGRAVSGRLFNQKGPATSLSRHGLASGEIECTADRLIPANETAGVFCIYFSRRLLGSLRRDQHGDITLSRHA